ncbi:MAG: D-alanyl-D-alanine carboxypeptidase family protein, partial [Butyricicoccus sp.]
SITKLLTALVALEQVEDFSQTTTVTAEALDVEYDSTRIGLMEGEVVTLEDMLNAMLIGSANDASNVLAEAVGGTLEDFSDLMNARAAELGCTGSHFVNAHGLDDDGQYATARDMALITRELLNHPEFEGICGTRMYVMDANDISGEERYFNCRQTMLMEDEADYYEGAFAGKNGYTSKALQTQVLCARRDGMTLISVTMSCPSKAEKVEDTTRLLDYGFENYTLATLDAVTLSGLIEDAGFDPAGVTLSDLQINLPKDADVSALSIAADRGEDGSLSLICSGDTLTLASLPYIDPADVPVSGETPADDAQPAANAGGGFSLSAFLAKFKLPEIDFGANTRLLLYIALGALAVVLLIIAVFSARASRVRRHREELSAMLRSAADRRDDEFDRLMERHDDLERDPFPADDEK